MESKFEKFKELFNENLSEKENLENFKKANFEIGTCYSVYKRLVTGGSKNTREKDRKILSVCNPGSKLEDNYRAVRSAGINVTKKVVALTLSKHNKNAIDFGFYNKSDKDLFTNTETYATRLGISEDDWNKILEDLVSSLEEFSIFGTNPRQYLVSIIKDVNEKTIEKLEKRLKELRSR